MLVGLGATLLIRDLSFFFECHLDHLDEFESLLSWITSNFKFPPQTVPIDMLSCLIQGEPVPHTLRVLQFFSDLGLSLPLTDLLSHFVASNDQPVLDWILSQLGSA